MTAASLTIDALDARVPLPHALFGNSGWSEALLLPTHGRGPVEFTCDEASPAE